jgi:chemotaxis protein MotB
MVTFSDLIMLLLTFFVLLLTMSSLDQKRLKDVFMALQDAAGVLEFSGSRGLTSLKEITKKYTDDEGRVVIDHDLVKNLLLPTISGKNPEEEQILEAMNERIEITDDERGLVLSFQEDILFDEGAAGIKAEVIPVLHKVAEALLPIPNGVLIMGHTDNVPIHNETYASNLELSMDRALSVLVFFLQEKRLSPARFMAGGYGSSRPLNANDSPRGRARNRRVEIIIKPLGRE